MSEIVWEQIQSGDVIKLHEEETMSINEALIKRIQELELERDEAYRRGWDAAIRNMRVTVQGVGEGGDGGGGASWYNAKEPK